LLENTLTGRFERPVSTPMRIAPRSTKRLFSSNSILSLEIISLSIKSQNSAKKSKDFLDPKTKARKIIFVLFQFCVPLGSG
jgi:hypothetical protein